MANELIHASVGTELTQAEWESIAAHILNAQATGDMIYASSASQLSRLGVGAANAVLRVSGGVPSWSDILAGLTLTSPTLTTPAINGVVTTTGLTLPAFTLAGNISLNGNWLSGDGGNEGISVNAAGNVGIGTASPSYTLHVLAPSGSQITSSIFEQAIAGNAAEAIGWIAAAFGGRNSLGDRVVLGSDIRGAIIGGHVNGLTAWAPLLLRTGGGGTGMTIDTAGNVGIGTTGPGVLLDLGLAGTKAGVVRLAGATSGNVTVAVAAAAGTWTMRLPTAVGTAGYQLTDAAGDGITSWAAAGSRREWKNLLPALDLSPASALNKLLSGKVHAFTFKDGMGTGDTGTVYHGIIADEAPWWTHFQESIFNPITAFGYTVLGFQAIDARVAILEKELAKLKGAR